jgi:hypothetical protein
MYCPLGHASRNGLPSFGIVEPIAYDLSLWLAHPAILQCGYGATDSQYWADNYAGTYAPWCAARVAELTTPTAVAVVIYQGESNCINNNASRWQSDWDGIIAARRAYWGNPHLLVIIVRLPDTCPLAHLAEVQAAQAALVAADPYAILVTDNTATGGIDIDGQSQERIAHVIATAIHNAYN